MNVKFYHWYNAVLAALLGLLGFSACENGDGPLCMYGTPTVNYQVQGTVTDEQDRPIQGIKVKVEVQYDTESLHPYSAGIDSVETDASGAYQTHMMSIPSYEGLKLIVEDVDGEANGGQFQSDTLELTDLPRQQTKKGDGAWNWGTYVLTGNVKLKK